MPTAAGPAELDSLQVLQQFVVEQGQPVSDAEVRLRQTQCQLLRKSARKQIVRARRCSDLHGDGELSPADLLPTEQVTGGLDGRKLKIQIRLEVKLYGPP
jgi:hypothetical protein